MSETEHHLHRTDMEWRAIIRNWKRELEQIELNSNEAYICRGYREILEQMEKETR